MSSQPSTSHQFEALTWNDIFTWAGRRVATRGRDYQKQGLVKDLAVLETGGLISTVIGTHRYAVQVRLNDETRLESRCTCPYGSACKHAVATVLEYLALVSQGRAIPRADPEDERLALPGTNETEIEDNGDPYFADTIIARQGRVKKQLERMTSPELVTLLLGFMDRYPEVASELDTLAQLRAGHVDRITANLRSKIRMLATEPDEYSNWGDDDCSEFTNICNEMEVMIEAGHADAVLALGKELVESGKILAETNDHDGSMSTDFSTCLAIFPLALEASSLSESEKLVWAMDLVLEDTFELCDELVRYLKEDHPASAWAVVSDHLLKRLETVDNHTSDYGRELSWSELAEWTIHALEHADREREAISLCEAEAERTGDYARLVDHLIAFGRHEDAERWIYQRFSATKKDSPKIAFKLQDALLLIKTHQQDWTAVITLRVVAFANSPSVEAFTQCKEAADHLDMWDAIRHTLLVHLASGQFPWQQSEWSLPQPDERLPHVGRQAPFPHFFSLIEIAIQEKETDTVLRWYDRGLKEGQSFYEDLENNIAAAIATSSPDRAMTIWKKLAEQEIALVQPRAYQTATGYLKNVAGIMLREKRATEWANYLEDLRKRHRRKTRLLEFLDTLDGKPIIKMTR